jgi:hypothetical protein
VRDRSGVAPYFGDTRAESPTRRGTPKKSLKLEIRSWKFEVRKGGKVFVSQRIIRIFAAALRKSRI